ncbi:MAG: ATP-dependent helicase [Anaerolineales bacterium]|nr:ATP-dependent helicase [Anaerolineales bacterium]
MGISAVPGSGKTFVLSHLAADLIARGGLEPGQEVLIVTLVNSAVDNFSGRISTLISKQGLLPRIGYRVRTLHGLAHDIVRERPEKVGLEERFAIIDEREAELISKEAANAWLSANPNTLDEYLDPELDENKRDRVRRQQLPDLVYHLALAFIRSAKDHRLTPELLRYKLDAAPARLPLAEMGWAVYKDYQRAIAYRGAVDFDDLIRLALDLLERDSDFLERLQSRWPYILEDEAQDSSQTQEEILRLLAAGQGNWVRVGDPNQAIFETFTTANPQYLLDFIRQEADTRRELPDSGRCQPAIIAAANQLIDWVMQDHPEEAARNALTTPYIQPTPPGDPQPNPPDDPDGIRFIDRKYSPDEEIKAVVDSIERWLPEHPQETAAVLVPRNARGVEMINALKQRGIPTHELLSSTQSTRAAAGALGNLITYLGDPTSAAKLARVYEVWRRSWREETEKQDLLADIKKRIRGCSQVETFLAPRPDRDWLSEISEGLPEEVLSELEEFRNHVIHWQGTTRLPIDQMILTLSQDLFTEPADLALAHKLALVLRKAAEDHPDWRLPELTGELGSIARNQRRFIGFSEDDSGFNPDTYKGKMVVTTMHKAKGLEWDRVYLMSVNNYDFPSNQTFDTYISEKWFIRGNLNLETEALAQLEATHSTGEYDWYEEGVATQQARLDYVKERLRLFYVGITRARRELIVTWNTGRQGNAGASLPFAALTGKQE